MDGRLEALECTYIVGNIHEGKALPLDAVNRQPVALTGVYNPGARVTTYKLVGPKFFLFFCYLMIGTGIIWIFMSMRIKEQAFVRF